MTNERYFHGTGRRKNAVGVVTVGDERIILLGIGRRGSRPTKTNGLVARRKPNHDELPAAF